MMAVDSSFVPSLSMEEILNTVITVPPYKVLLLRINTPLKYLKPKYWGEVLKFADKTIKIKELLQELRGFYKDVFYTLIPFDIYFDYWLHLNKHVVAEYDHRIVEEKLDTFKFIGSYDNINYLASLGPLVVNEINKFPRTFSRRILY